MVIARLRITDSAESSASVYRLIRNSDATRARISGTMNGFDMKSSAPTSSPRTRLSVSVSPVTSTTGMRRVAGSFFSRRQTS